MYKFSDRSKEKLKGVHPNLVKFFNELINIANDDFSIVEGVRTLETQKNITHGAELYLLMIGEKKSLSPLLKLMVLRKKVNIKYKLMDIHMQLIYVLLGRSKEERYDLNKFRRLREKATPLMDQYNITWGGDWKSFKDRPHWQLKD